MKRRALITLAAVVVAFVAGSAIASAQKVVAADIGFAFVAGGKDMAAGKYTIEVPVGGPVILKGSTGNSGLLPIITTLGRHDQDQGTEFVFDKIDGKLVLSEIWLSGQDGFLLLATKAPHEHAVLGGSNPKK
jgi:hypothetical protein